MPGGHSTAEQPQHRYVKGLDDARAQAQSLHGKRSLTDIEVRQRRPKRKSGNGIGGDNGPAGIPTLSLVEKSKREATRKHADGQPAASSARNQQMNSAPASPTSLTFYPAYCHKASPTYFQWVKLTAQDIHHSLHHREGYLHSWITQQICSHSRDVPQLLFYKNHPIQFIQAIGIVVNLEEYFEKLWLFTIDDSSGATIDVVCRKPDRNKTMVQTYKTDTSDHEKEADMEIQKLSDQVAAEVDVGAILQVKGTITLFQRINQINQTSLCISHANMRQQVAPKQDVPTRQITLQRLAVVHDTNKEIALIGARTKFYEGVLNKPWSLTKQEQNKLHKKALGEVEHKRKKVRRHTEKERKAKDEEARDAEVILREYAEEDRGREQEAAKARAAGEALEESGVWERMAAQVLPNVATTPNELAKPLTTRNEDAKAAKKEKRKKRKPANGVTEAQMSTTASPRGGYCTTEDASLSFAADDGERSALLRAAFG